MRGPGHFRLANPPGRNRTGPTTAGGHFQIRSTPLTPLQIPPANATPTGRQSERSGRPASSGRTVGATPRLFHHTSIPTGMPGRPAMLAGGRHYVASAKSVPAPQSRGPRDRGGRSSRPSAQGRSPGTRGRPCCGGSPANINGV